MFGELGDNLHNSSNASSQQAMEIVLAVYVNSQPYETSQGSA